MQDPDEGTNEHADPVVAEHDSEEIRILSADSEISPAWSSLWQSVVGLGTQYSPAACHEGHGPDEGGVNHDNEKDGEGCLGFWRVNSPAACQDVHGPDEGEVDHVQDEGGEWRPGLWRGNSPAACQDVHGPDEGEVDHVQDEDGCERCPGFWRVNLPCGLPGHAWSRSCHGKVMKGAPDCGR